MAMNWPKSNRRGAMAKLACGLLMATAFGVAVPVHAASEPATPGAESVVRRITPEQYQRIIKDVFGPTIKVNGRFEPEPRVDGLRALGSSRVSVSAAGLQGYDAMARDIAGQVVNEYQRGTLLPCVPASARQPDDGCAGQVLASAGGLLYRRPLSQGELQGLVNDAAAAAKELKDFYAGLSLGIASLLTAPEFLFRKEVPENLGSTADASQISGYSKAARLSFFLWDSAPDGELLRAAAAGELDTEKGLNRQVERLLSSPRIEAGVRAFFTDMLGLDGFDTLTKDAVLYPKFFADVPKDAKEQTLRTIVDHLLARRGDYRDLFTTRRTFLTPLLGAVYRVPVPENAPNTDPSRWVAHEYPEGDQHIGLLTQAGFAALHSHPGRTSPTIRGKALREILLCQKVPDPPGNVNFTVVQDVANPVYKTARARLNAHATESMCTGCHKITDPMGLALENFDATGSYRNRENGVGIDTSGVLDGVTFSDVAGLAKAVHDHPALSSCLVKRVYSYAAGRPAAEGEAEFVSYLSKGFVEDRYQLPALLRRIATSKAFYRVSAPVKSAGDTSISDRENAK